MALRVRRGPAIDVSIGAEPQRKEGARHSRAAITGFFAVLCVFVAMPMPAAAASLGELRAEARGVGISPGSGGAGEQAALERLGRIALEFLDAADTGGGDATGAYEAIVDPLDRSYEAHKAALDRMSRGVIDADGDLDALYESAPWQEHQQLAAQALYYLNWLHYRGALLYGGAKRKQLLEQAAKGFGEFATSNKASAVVVESHLGRGLAYLELDKNDWAINDFEAVVQSKGASADRVRKARLALAEAYVKDGRSADALRTSQQAVAEATPADQPRAQLTRVRALAMAAASAPAAQKATYRSEATSLLAQLQAGGGPWGARAATIARAGLDNPKIWASGAKPAKEEKPVPPTPTEWEATKQLVATAKYKEVIPRLERIVGSTSPDDQPNQGEARYFLALSRFRTGDLQKAIADFDAVLAAKDKASYRDDAAYLRFKANEALYAADATAARLPQYEQSIVAFVSEHPNHKAVPEARFRLGEIRQRQERYTDAIAEYARVKGDPAFELRAAFGTAQSTVKQLEATPEGKKPDAVLMRQATAALDRFWSQIASEEFAKFGDAPVTEFMGQAALMRAYLAALGDPPDYEQAVAWLGDYERKYPTLTRQRAQVTKLRLAAFARLGRLEDAAAESEKPAVAELDAEFLDDLATRFITTAAREQASGKPEAAAAGRRAALHVSERALAATDSSPALKQRLRATAARLYEDAGERDKALALYRESLAASPDAIAARAGAARILEAQGKAGEARALWDEVSSLPQGKAGWLEAHYQSARLSIALGDPARACSVLKQVPAEMIMNANNETPKKIQELIRTTCRS